MNKQAPRMTMNQDGRRLAFQAQAQAAQIWILRSLLSQLSIDRERYAVLMEMSSGLRTLFNDHPWGTLPEGMADDLRGVLEVTQREEEKAGLRCAAGNQMLWAVTGLTFEQALEQYWAVAPAGGA